MSCLPCFSCQKNKTKRSLSNRRSLPRSQPGSSPRQRGTHKQVDPPPSEIPRSKPPTHHQEAQIDKDGIKNNNNNKNNDHKNGGNNPIAAQTFTFRELATATRNFRQECLLGEGGFGRVYKGKLQKNDLTVAVKQLDRNGTQGNREFLVEVMMLSLLHHSNLVSLIGYCADGDQRLLVYEYMASGSLEDHLLELPPGKRGLNWSRRMRIALGAAKGLEYLHDRANPPVIYRDLKASNILLDEEYNAKLSDFGLAKLGPVGDRSHVSSRVMGTYGYCAPEYQRTGHLTVKSDVYSFGVVLLELISGRRAIDTTRSTNEQNLVTWALPVFKDPRRFPELADPLLDNKFPVRGLNQAVAVAAMCLQEAAAVRPLMSDVVSALSFLGDEEEPEAESSAAGYPTLASLASFVSEYTTDADDDDDRHEDAASDADYNNDDNSGNL